MAEVVLRKLEEHHISPKSVVSVTSDGGSNMLKALRILVGQYPSLMTLRCYAHVLNLTLKEAFTARKRRQRKKCVEEHEGEKENAAERAGEDGAEKGATGDDGEEKCATGDSGEEKCATGDNGEEKYPEEHEGDDAEETCAEEDEAEETCAEADEAEEGAENEEEEEHMFDEEAEEDVLARVREMMESVIRNSCTLRSSKWAKLLRTEGKAKVLPLVVAPTRWNSRCAVLERYLRLFESIQAAAAANNKLQPKQRATLVINHSDADKEYLQQMLKLLKAFEIATDEVQGDLDSPSMLSSHNKVPHSPLTASTHFCLTFKLCKTLADIRVDSEVVHDVRVMASTLLRILLRRWTGSHENDAVYTAAMLLSPPSVMRQLELPRSPTWTQMFTSLKDAVSVLADRFEDLLSAMNDRRGTPGMSPILSCVARCHATSFQFPSSTKVLSSINAQSASQETHGSCTRQFRPLTTPACIVSSL